MLTKILLILQKNKHHLTFIFLVFLSFILIYNNNANTNTPLQAFGSALGTFIKSPITRINLLVKSAYDNELLREQLMLVSLEMESLYEYEMENESLKSMLDFKRETNISMIPAKVINMGLTSNLLSMTIDIGSDSGVLKNNPVITPSGIIGKISAVNDKSAIVQLISDPDFRISVRFVPSGATGILRWRNDNICDVREVYKNSEINVGDRVITSGLSNIFPTGLHVGIVSSVANDRNQFQKVVSVKIEENLSSILYVFVIISDEEI